MGRARRIECFHFSVDPPAPQGGDVRLDLDGFVV
jgi:hypothetical protein